LFLLNIKVGLYFTEIIWRYDDFQDGGPPPFGISNFENFHIRPSLFSDFASAYKISGKSDNPLPSYRQNWCFSIWCPPAIL